MWCLVPATHHIMQYRNNLKSERHVREFIEQLGGVLVEAHITTHWKITVLIGGRTIRTTLAISPSDKHTRVFEATRIKRMGRGVYEGAEWLTLQRG